MRVRPLRPTRTASTAERRPHVVERPAAPAAAPAPAPPAVEQVEHLAERRHRECVACEDSALYSCSCGFQFTAPVTTSVACPHCGTAQAW
jgi:predicted Zn-ribbon and HTH transcriptional regulator